MFTTKSLSILILMVYSCVGVQRIPSLELINGEKMPMIGLGTFRIQDNATAQRIVEEAIEVGYRHIDTAYHYQNEQFIGQKLNELFSNNTIKRNDIFITSKLWNTFHKRESVMKGLNLSLEALGIKQLDLALIHFPMAFKEDTGEYIPVDENGLTLDLDIDVAETWKGMEDALRAGLTKSIGVSNFNITQIERILKKGSIKPVVNQVEIHPYLTQVPLVDYCKSNGIHLVAYSPIAKANQTLFNEPVLNELANKYNKTVPQVIMRWIIQRDIIVIPKTTKKERLIENIDIFDFQLNDEEMTQIFALNKNYRITRYENARYNPNYPYEWPFETIFNYLRTPTPTVGLGTSQLTDQNLINNLLEKAISVGYKHIDTAYSYNNEKQIGNKLKELIAKNKIKRKDIFITSKVWSTFHSRPKVIEAIKLSVDKLGLDYLDLALIHWPMAFIENTTQLLPQYSNGSTIDANISIIDTWKGMEDAYRLGLTKNIGVSNFNSEQLSRILRESQIKPLVNQIECNPYLNQKLLIEFCKNNSIEVIAYSPLRRGDTELLNEEILKNIANKLNKSVAQIIFRWLIQRGIKIIPKTSKNERLKENISIFDFTLSDEQMEEIDSLNKNKRRFIYSEAKNNPEYPFNIEF